MNFLSISKQIKRYLSEQNLDPEYIDLMHLFLGIAALFIFLSLALYVLRLILVNTIYLVITRTRPHWHQQLRHFKVFRSVALVIVAIVLYFAVPVLFQDYKSWRYFALLGAKVFIVISVVSALSAFMNAMVVIMESSNRYNDTPVRSYKQLTKILLYILGFVLILSTILSESPLYILGGFGAITAVMLLIFRDPILGFVASLQMGAIDLVRMGDWISMDKYGADGEVIEINLTTIKVRNWDRTITIVPSYAIVSESFRNWRAMEESEGRRIKRHINIKISSIKFCDPELMDRLLKIDYLKEYLTETNRQLQAYNEENHSGIEHLVNGQHMTNIGTFRYYAEMYLKHNPNLNLDMTYLVRQLQATEHGLPLEVYVFSKEKSLKKYEEVAADIFDHLYAIVPYFDLEIFQSPSGSDMRRLNAS